MSMICMDYFTDAYCAWSWAFQPTLEALLAEEGGRLEIRYHQLPIFEDLRASGKDGQAMIDEWEEIRQKTGRPLNMALWWKTPPNSTVPAARAAKAAARQGNLAEGRFLKELRQMLMTEARTADDRRTLLQAADKARLDMTAFRSDLLEAGLEAEVDADKELAKREAACATPSVILRNESGDKVHIEGPRDLELFRQAIRVLRGEVG